MNKRNEHTLPNSVPLRVAGATSRGAVPRDHRHRVAVVLKANCDVDEELWKRVGMVGSTPPLSRPRFTVEELLQINGPAKGVAAKVREFAATHGLDIVRFSRSRCDMLLEGNTAAINRAFNLDLERFEDDEGHFRAHQQPISVPRGLVDAIEAVLGLDDIPMAKSHFASGPPASRLFSVEEVARFYNIPRGHTGKGQRIGVLSFAGGYHPADLTEYFTGLTTHAVPVVKSHSAGGSNQPLDRATLGRFAAALIEPGQNFEKLAKRFKGQFADAINTMEVTMDIELSGSLAPDARIDVFFAPPTSLGYRMAIYAALGVTHEGFERPPVTVISVSWGNKESSWNDNGMRAIDPALRLARDMGVVVCCASGDDGSWTEDGCANAVFPASSPNVLACGGTTLVVDGGEIVGEESWNSTALGRQMATGGGMSGFFERPPHQDEAGVPGPGGNLGQTWISPTLKGDDSFRGRGLPDVAANADLNTGFRILAGGQVTNGGGTSAATPFWAGLLTAFSDDLGCPVGWFNPLLYSHPFKHVSRQVTKGNNKVGSGGGAYYEAKPGARWNGCCGFGSPDGKRLLGALSRR